MPNQCHMLSSSVTERRSMTMQDQVNATPVAHGRVPWNKGKLTGAKPPLRTKHVWSIRTKLQIAGRARDLAMFNLAIDSKLRGCDVVAIKVDDITLAEVALIRSPRRQGRAPWPGWSLGQPGLPQSFCSARGFAPWRRRVRKLLDLGSNTVVC